LGNFVGTPGNDNITGTTGNDVFDLTQGGDDTVVGNGGFDVFNFGSALNAGDFIDGGANSGGPRNIVIDGDYSAGVVINARNIDNLVLGTNHSYNLTLGSGLRVVPFFRVTLRIRRGFSGRTKPSFRCIRPGDG
jgi:hypothetical protein